MFENENTLARFRSQGIEEEFHKEYETAVAEFQQNLGKIYPMIISGQEVSSSEGTFDDTSPSNTSLILGRFQKGTKEHARQAISAARKAFETWSVTPYAERVDLFRRAADLASGQKFRLAAEMTFENGKTRYEAMADVDEGIDFIRYYAEQLEENKGFEMAMGHSAPNEKTKSLLRPYGVWSVIAPFNFPFAIATGMSTGASIAGNTVVLKPASDTPLLSYELCKILEQAGLPAGVYNFVTGSGSTVGAELVENPHVSGVVFTGSYDVGARSLSEFESKSPRPFVAEMGGKNATIVTDKADLGKAVEGVVRGAFGFGGQKCSACSRVYVQEKVRDEFVGQLVLKTAELKLGDPAQKSSFLGPVINEAAYNNYQAFIAQAEKEASIACGGRVIKSGNLAKGFFAEPTVVVDVPKDSSLIKTEMFVPILTVETYSKLEDAIRRVNNVDYGLTSGIFSGDETEIKEFFQKVDAGVVYANRVSGSTTGAMVGNQPFVGWKKSGSTGKGAGGPFYLQQFLREQSQTEYT
jgi:1-pyrroline-5-carboxylate dehydrogenase